MFSFSTSIWIVKSNRCCCAHPLISSCMFCQNPAHLSNSKEKKKQKNKQIKCRREKNPLNSGTVSSTDLKALPVISPMDNGNECGSEPIGPGTENVGRKDKDKMEKNILHIYWNPNEYFQYIQTKYNINLDLEANRGKRMQSWWGLTMENVVPHLYNISCCWIYLYTWSTLNACDAQFSFDVSFSHHFPLALLCFRFSAERRLHLLELFDGRWTVWSGRYDQCIQTQYWVLLRDDYSFLKAKKYCYRYLFCRLWNRLGVGLLPMPNGTHSIRFIYYSINVVRLVDHFRHVASELTTHSLEAVGTWIETIGLHCHQHHHDALPNGARFNKNKIA